MEYAKRRANAFLSASGDLAKDFLRGESISRAKNTRSFLPEARTQMTTEKETEMILRRAFEYIVALMEFNLVNLKFQLNHFLYEGFKVALSKSLKTRLVDEADWNELVEADPDVQHQLEELEIHITALEDALRKVQRMQRRI